MLISVELSSDVGALNGVIFVGTVEQYNTEFAEANIRECYGTVTTGIKIKMWVDGLCKSAKHIYVTEDSVMPTIP